MNWFTVAGVIIALCAAVAAGALLHIAAERPGAFSDWWRRHIVDDDPYPPDKDAGMRAARQRHPANRVTWTCHTCHEALAGPMVEHICGGDA